jgi:hypothetical protein
VGRIVGVVFLAGLGFLVGILVSAQGGGSYTATDEYWTHTHSHAAMQLEAVARRQQHIRGIRVRVHNAYTFEVTGHGSSQGAVQTLNTANHQIWKAVKRLRLAHVSMIYGGLHELVRPSQGIAIRHGVIWLLAGLGIGLGIVLPFRRRATAAHFS